MYLKIKTAKTVRPYLERVASFSVNYLFPEGSSDQISKNKSRDRKPKPVSYIVGCTPLILVVRPKKCKKTKSELKQYI